MEKETMKHWPLFLLCMLLGTLVAGPVGLIGGVVAAFIIDRQNPTT